MSGFGLSRHITLFAEKTPFRHLVLRRQNYEYFILEMNISKAFCRSIDTTLGDERSSPFSIGNVENAA